MAGADRPSKWKFPVLFFGSLLGLALLFQLVESLLPSRPAVESAVAESGIAAGTDDGTDADSDTAAEAEDAMQGPIRPTLTRTDENTIEIGLGFMRRSRYIFDETDDPAEVDAFHACLEKDFEETFGAPEWNPANPGPADRSALRRRMKTVVREIVDGCMDDS